MQSRAKSVTMIDKKEWKLPSFTWWGTASCQAVNEKRLKTKNFIKIFDKSE